MGRFHPWAVPDPEPGSDPYLLHSLTSGSGPPMVLIHGVAGSHMVWDRVVPLLDAHFTVIRMELLGYGRSPKPRIRHTPLRHVTAIRRTLTHGGVAGPVALVGLSMGSNLMVEYAARWPDEVQQMVGIGFPFYPSEAAARIGLRHNLWTRLALQFPVLAGVIVPVAWWAGRLAATALLAWTAMLRLRRTGDGWCLALTCLWIAEVSTLVSTGRGGGLSVVATTYFVPIGVFVALFFGVWIVTISSPRRPLWWCS